MSLFKKILFPADLSEASKKIVPYVEELINKFGAELHIVHAMSVAQQYVSPTMAAPYIGDVEPEIRAETEKMIKGFIESHFKGISVKSKILSGLPGPEIIRYTEEEGFDLIVMGHSSTGIARAVFGSVAGHVVKHSPVPVLVISPSILENKA